MSSNKILGPVVGVAAVIFCAHTTLELSGWPNGRVAQTMNALALPLIGLVSVPLAARAGRSSRGRLRAAWVAVAVALSWWTLAQAWWARYTLVEAAIPFPSLGDAAYLSYLAAVVVALVLFPSTRTWRDQSRLILDGLVVAGSFFLIFWLAVMRSEWRNSQSSGLEFAVSMAYPVGNVLVMTVGLVVLVRTGAGLRTTLMLLVGGFAFSVLAEVLFAYTRNSADHPLKSLPDTLVMGGALLVLVAVVAAQRPQAADTPVADSHSVFALWLPLLPVAFAALFVAAAGSDAVTEAPVVITCVFLVAATLVRQLLEAAELIRRERQNRLLASRLNAELESAARYVASILPGELIGPVAARSRYLPSRAVGGDSFGYSWIDDDHLMVYLIDVSGHGVRPALLSVSVHNLLRSRSLSPEILLEPDRVLTALNERFAMDKHDDHYFTMWFGVYRLSTGVLRYANAGHPPPLVLTTEDDGVRCTPLPGFSVPVGMFADSPFTAHSCEIPSGTRMLLYSDGILGDRLAMDEFVRRCAELATLESTWAETSWMDALLDGIPLSDDGHAEDDCSLVELAFGR